MNRLIFVLAAFPLSSAPPAADIGDCAKPGDVTSVGCLIGLAVVSAEGPTTKNFFPDEVGAREGWKSSTKRTHSRQRKATLAALKGSKSNPWTVSAYVLRHT